jgi:hypothetical protein
VAVPAVSAEAITISCGEDSIPSRPWLAGSGEALGAASMGGLIADCRDIGRAEADVATRAQSAVLGSEACFPAWTALYLMYQFCMPTWIPIGCARPPLTHSCVRCFP